MCQQWHQMLVCVCAFKKGGVKSEKKGQERRVRRWKRGEKKTNKDDKMHWHPNTHSPVLSSRLNTHSHEVEVLGTLHSQTLCVCVWQWMTNNKSQVKTQTNHTQCFWALPCVCVSERQKDAQTIRSVKGVRRVIDKMTRQDLSSHDGKAVHIHSTSVVFGASGHLWCHEEWCAKKKPAVSPSFTEQKPHTTMMNTGGRALLFEQTKTKKTSKHRRVSIPGCP